MYSAIPKAWRENFPENVTLAELNSSLVELHIPTITFIAILMVVGVLGNILVVYVYTFKYSPSTYRSFILWLGWVDLIACTVGMPLLIVSMLYPYMFPSEAACKSLRFLHVFFVAASAFIVIGIAIERHRRVRYPFSSDLTSTKIKIMCIVASALGCIVALPAIFVYGDASVDTGVHGINGTECFIDPKFQYSKFPQGYFMFQLSLSVICMAIMGILYFRIGRTIMRHHYTSETTPNGIENKDRYLNQWKRAIRKTDLTKYPTPFVAGQSAAKRFHTQIVIGNKLESSRSSVSNKGPSLRTKQVTFMLFIITVVFLLSFIPHLGLMVTISIKSDFPELMSPAGVAVYNLFLRSFVINNMANPIIYTFCDKKFRKEIATVACNVVTCCRSN